MHLDVEAMVSAASSTSAPARTLVLIIPLSTKLLQALMATVDFRLSISDTVWVKLQSTF